MKKITLILVLLLAIVAVKAQEQDKVRLGLDGGFAMPTHGGGGIMGGLEFKYNLSDNWNIGVRGELAGTGKDIGGNKSDVSMNGSVLAVTDYYFNNGNSNFAPFIGVGIGVARLGGAQVNSDDKRIPDDEVSKTTKGVGLARIGFEYSRLRVTANYYGIPTTTYTNTLGQDFTIKNSYFSFGIGFYIGGGKWKK